MEQYDEASVTGLVILNLDSSGCVADANASALRVLGYALENLRGLKFDSLLHASHEFSIRVPGASQRVVLRCADEISTVDLTGIFVEGAGGPSGTGRMFVAIPQADISHLPGEVEETISLLKGFIDLSSEAMWCMEYSEPVVLNTSHPEIIRQVFENKCHWRMCNRAMAQIYNLPEGLDLNRQRVSSYFRRSPTNEAFVRELIESSFHIDSAPSVDVRHDGTVAYMENSVRCRIEDGKMLRMWGTVRDTTEFRTAHNRLAQREREVREVLSAIPDAVLVVNKAKHLLAVNPAFESAFGWRAHDVLGKDVSAIINLDSRREDDHRWFARAEQRWIADIAQADGTVVACDVRMAPFPDDEFSRFVLCLRPTAATPAELASSARAHRPRRAKSTAIRR